MITDARTLSTTDPLGCIFLLSPLTWPLFWPQPPGPAAQVEAGDSGNKRLVSGLAPSQKQLLLTHPWPHCSHDFIGEFTTSYRELSKAQNQFTVYEVRTPALSRLPRPSSPVCSVCSSLPLFPTITVIFFT